MGEPTLKWSFPPSTVDSSSPSTNSVGKFLYNNAFVADSSAPATHANGQSIPGIPIELYKKTRTISHTPATTSPSPSPAVTTTTYTSTNPAGNNNLIALKGGVYEKAEFITSTIGSTTYPTTGNPAFQNNVVFIDSGGDGTIGPPIPYADGNSQGANIEANVGWTASTLNATAGFHSNNQSTPFGQSTFNSQIPSGSLNTVTSISGIPYVQTVTNNPPSPGTSSGSPGAGTISFPGNSGIGPSFRGSFTKGVGILILPISTFATRLPIAVVPFLVESSYFVFTLLMDRRSITESE